MPGTNKNAARAGASAEIDALTALLREEITAIGQGDTAKLAALFPRKTALLEALEAAAPALENAVRQGGAQEPGLPDKLKILQSLIQNDAALLARMRDATGGLVAEITRIRDRHGLKGLYGARGEPRNGTVTAPQRFDQQV
ncbi:flagellar export chaperone FlgN [Actibacterium sp. MT2.3-13A]|uniref:flagellar export chaperone FlgN n=1 Tax=Actibacterium sp. MT2.3-13A TaxID=2828332 RepID=UPI001BAA58D9|nr:flagellar export chaperone FlgN [Actibacterium sp. MT2.3-13A]